MTDPRIEKLARVLVDYSVAVRPNDKVAIAAGSQASPLIKEIYACVLRSGGFPWLIPSLPGIEEILFRDASDAQLSHVPEPLEQMIKTYDVWINIAAKTNTRSLTGVDPHKLLLRSQGQKNILQTLMSRSASGELRWTLAIFPTDAYAQDAEMGLEEYEDFVYSACLPDLDDPVGYWQRFARSQQRIVDWLKGRKEVRIKGLETDLRMSIVGRTFENCDGHKNMPDGEVYSGPVEDSVEGHVYFSYPAIYEGKEFRGIRLWFEKGRVVKATAEKNESRLNSILDTDSGSRYLGEFAIGTNDSIQRFTGETLFDEKIGGSFHIALGAGIPETGSVNQSAIHWDLVCDLKEDGEIWVDDNLIHKNGKFLI
jgi:aminopeptidase